jgi:hypothetical protein
VYEYQCLRVVVRSVLWAQRHSRADHKPGHPAIGNQFPSLVQMGHSATDWRSVVCAWRVQGSGRIYVTNDTTPRLLPVQGIKTCVIRTTATPSTIRVVLGLRTTGCRNKKRTGPH